MTWQVLDTWKKIKNSSAWRRKNMIYNFEVLSKLLTKLYILHFQHMQFYLLLIDLIWGQRAYFSRVGSCFWGIEGFTQDHKIGKRQGLKFWSKFVWLHCTWCSYWKVKLVRNGKGYQRSENTWIGKNTKQIMNHLSQDWNHLIFKIRFFKMSVST